MFKHIFITRIKCLVRDKQLFFWSLLFPLILATLFKVTIANISTDTFKPIDIAVVNDGNYEKDPGFKNVIKQVSEDNEGKLFNVSFTDEKEAEALLKDSKIKGYIYLNPEINLVVKASGINETFIKTFLDNYKQNAAITASIIKANPKVSITDLVKDISNYKEYTEEKSVSDRKPNTNLTYFYALIAMACLYGSFLGLKEVMDIQADLSKRAARVNMVPVKKIKVFIYGVTAAFTIQFTEVLILLVYLHFGLKVDFGNQLPYILLLSFTGCMAGVSFGTMVSACIKKGEGIKLAILIGLTLLGCAMSGMYNANMKYIVEKNIPLLAYINPAALITDGFYVLYYYTSYERFFINVFLLTALSGVFCYVSYLIIRRQKYANL